MTDNYVERRRSYVSEVRNSFETDYPEDTSFKEGQQPVANSFSFTKIRILLSVILFSLFSVFLFSGARIIGYNAYDLIDIIEDNHYDTELKKYIKESFSSLNYESNK